MAEQVLNVTGLAARVEDKQLLHGVDLTINKGETHVLMGPNGAGKSTLGYVLMGSPKYTVTDGSIVFEGQDITEESADKRARAGMFLSFQEPLEVTGLTLERFIPGPLYGNPSNGPGLCPAQSECGIFWWREEKSRDFTADDAQALAGHSGRDGFRPGRGRGATCLPGN